MLNTSNRYFYTDFIYNEPNEISEINNENDPAIVLNYINSNINNRIKITARFLKNKLFDNEGLAKHNLHILDLAIFKIIILYYTEKQIYYNDNIGIIILWRIKIVLKKIIDL